MLSPKPPADAGSISPVPAVSPLALTPGKVEARAVVLSSAANRSRFIGMPLTGSVNLGMVSGSLSGRFGAVIFLSN